MAKMIIKEHNLLSKRGRIETGNQMTSPALGRTTHKVVKSRSCPSTPNHPTIELVLKNTRTLCKIHDTLSISSDFTDGE